MHKFSAIAFLFLILFSCKKVEKTSINLELKKELSEITIKSSDPSLSSSLVGAMSTRFKNVKLNGVEGSGNDGNQISKITYKIN